MCYKKKGKPLLCDALFVSQVFVAFLKIDTEYFNLSHYSIFMKSKLKKIKYFPVSQSCSQEYKKKHIIRPKKSRF